jgi:hypothetical protein
MKKTNFSILVILCLAVPVLSGCTEKYVVKEQVIVETREVVE